MAKSSVELIRELTVDVRLMGSRNEWLAAQLADQKAMDQQQQAEITELRKENADLRLQIAEARREIDLLKQQLQEVVKKVDTADSRRWTLVLALFGAVMSLAAGLIVSLTRK